MIDKKINYAIIGCGARISELMKHLEKKNNIELKGVWDISEKNAKDLLDKRNNGEGKVYKSYEEIVNDNEIDWVLVGSPNAFHKEHIITAFNSGKHVFSEKPIAISIEDCIEINKSHKDSGKLFATGFTLRYATIYRKTKELLSSGILGDIVSINASENILPEHGAYIMKNWRRKKELAGAHILEKCIHDLDLLNWFTDSLPRKIATLGGNDMFIPKNEQVYIDHNEIFESANWDRISDKFEQSDENPFLSDKTIEDNIVTIMEYKNGIKAQFQATMCNAIPERRMFFHCTKGTLIVELYSGTVKYKAIGDDAVKIMNFVGGGHGDGDLHIMEELHDSMVNGTKPICSGSEGLRSAVVGISIDNARIEGKVLDISGVWESLGIS